MRAASLAVVCAALLGGDGTLASTAYLGLEPGWARQAEVAKVLGAPALKLADMLHEHTPQPGTGPIYVEYRPGSDVVDRLEVKLVSAVTRAEVVSALRLSAEPVATKTASGGTLLEYYANGSAIALGYAGGNAASGVNAIAYLSDRLFEREVERAGGAGPPPTAGGGQLPPPGTGMPGSPGGAVPAPTAPPALAGTIPPSVRRDPAACYDLYLYADVQEAVARKSRNVVRRQRAMDIRIAAQSGDCDRARRLADDYRKIFPSP